MRSVFDVVSVLAFVGIVAAWLSWTRRKDNGTLFHFLLVAATLAVANQAGNAGWTLLGVVLIIAACGYALVIVRT